MGIATQDELKLINIVSCILLDSDMANLHRVFNKWPSQRQLKYIEHMKRLAAEDPDKFVLFSDLVAEITARQLGV